MCFLVLNTQLLPNKCFFSLTYLIFLIHIAIMPFSWQNEIQKNSFQQQNEKEDGTL